MPFWKRRKVLYTWDDNHVPTLESKVVDLSDKFITWTCPRDRYVEITMVHAQLHLDGGLRSAGMFWGLRSFQTKYFYIQIHRVLASHTTYHFYLSLLGGEHDVILVSSAINYHMPFQIKLLPGESLFFENVGDFYPLDHWERFDIRYNRYDLT